MCKSEALPNVSGENGHYFEPAWGEAVTINRPFYFAVVKEGQAIVQLGFINNPQQTEVFMANNGMSDWVDEIDH